MTSQDIFFSNKIKRNKRKVMKAKVKLNNFSFSKIRSVKNKRLKQQTILQINIKFNFKFNYYLDINKCLKSFKPI